jgi:hypothetical protein
MRNKLGIDTGFSTLLMNDLLNVGDRVVSSLKTTNTIQPEPRTYEHHCPNGTSPLPRINEDFTNLCTRTWVYTPNNKRQRTCHIRQSPQQRSSWIKAVPNAIRNSTILLDYIPINNTIGFARRVNYDLRHRGFGDKFLLSYVATSNYRYRFQRTDVSSGAHRTYFVSRSSRRGNKVSNGSYASSLQINFSSTLGGGNSLLTETAEATLKVGNTKSFRNPNRRFRVKVTKP